jgi:hypothetical protein
MLTLFLTQLNLVVCPFRSRGVVENLDQNLQYVAKLLTVDVERAKEIR